MNFRTMDRPPKNDSVATKKASTGIIAKLRSPLREFGFVAGSLYLLDQALSRVSPGLGVYAYEMMVQPIVDKPLLSAGLSKNLEFREIRRGDPEIDLMPARADIKESRFEQKAMCLGTYQRGTLIGYIWFAFGEYKEDEARCTYVLPKDYPSVFDFDLYVMPEKRMGIGFMGIWHGANRYLWDRGVRYTFSRLTRFNTASRRSHSHLGWKRVGRVAFLKLWGLQLMVSDLRPFVHVCFGALNPPRLVLSPSALLAQGTQTIRGPQTGSGQQRQEKE